MKKSKANGFKRQFKDSLSYLRGSRNYILVIATIFLAGILLGFSFYSQLSFLDGILDGLIEKIRGLSTPGIILFIMQNNIKSAFYGLLFGAVLGIFPLMNSLSNGVVLGYVMNGVWVNSGIREFWRILPHGIFELPAIFISLSLGLKLGMFIFQKNKLSELSERARNSMISFVCIVIPLLIVAAVIEGLLIAAYK